MDSGEFKYKNCYNTGDLGGLFGGLFGGGTASEQVCDSIKSSASGLWTTGGVSYAILPQLNLIGRIGLDLGDDDGLMVGAGVGYMFADAFELRGEYVVRDNIDSLQVNFVYRF